MRDAAASDRSVAVVFAGWLNVNIPRQGATTREFLVDPLHADVVVFGTFVPRNYDHRRQPDCADGGGDCLLANVAALRPIRTALALRRGLRRDAGDALRALLGGPGGLEPPSPFPEGPGGPEAV